MRALLAILIVALLAVPASAEAPRASLAPSVASSHLVALAQLEGIAVLPEPALPAGDLRAQILAHYAAHGAIPTARGLAELDARLQVVPAPIQDSVARILAAQNAAAQLRADAFARVTPADERFIWDRLGAETLAPADAVEAARIMGLVDAAKMNLAARLVLDTVSAEKPNLVAHAGEMGAAIFTDPLGQIEIAGTGDDTHAQDRALLVDLGGNDNWTNNAGATKPDFIIDALPGCISTGGLDCTPLDGRRNGDVTNDLTGARCEAYVDRAAFGGDAAVTTNCTPANGDILGWESMFVSRGTLAQGDEHDVALGIDVAGDDRYAPPKAFNDINNGHNAAGCDTRANGEQGKTWARNLTAGGAFAGVGILWDMQGSDFYGGRSIAEGSGHLVGMGILVDEGAGDNVFSGVRLSEGVGFFGGVGLLDVEGRGNDQYRLENNATFFNEFEAFVGCDVSTRDGQGRGNFNGAGILIDAGGNDAYFVQSHDLRLAGAVRDDPKTTQGSAGARLNLIGPPVDQVAATSLGVLLDEGGHDSYTRAGRADGVQDVAPQEALFWDTESGLPAAPIPGVVPGLIQSPLAALHAEIDSAACAAGAIESCAFWTGGSGTGQAASIAICGDGFPLRLGNLIWNPQPFQVPLTGSKPLGLGPQPLPAVFVPTVGGVLGGFGGRDGLGICHGGPRTPQHLVDTVLP